MKEIKRSTKIQLLKSGACILVALVLIINTVFLYASSDGEESADPSPSVTETETSTDTAKGEETQDTAEIPADVPGADVPQADPVPDSSDSNPQDSETPDSIETGTGETPNETSEADSNATLPGDNDVLPTVSPSETPTPSSTVESETVSELSAQGNLPAGISNVTMTLANGSVPESAKLNVSEASASLNDFTGTFGNEFSVVGSKLFDIKIDGVEDLPEGTTATVTVNFSDPIYDTSNSKGVQYALLHKSHRTSDIENIDASFSADLRSITFTTDSFCPFAALAFTSGVKTLNETGEENTGVTTDLSELLSGLSIEGATEVNGQLVVETGVSYRIDMIFKETKNLQFDAEKPMTYKLPAGVVPKTQGGEITLNSANGEYSVKAVYTIDPDGLVTITLDQSEESDFDKFQAASNAQIWLSLQVEFEKSDKEISFGTTGTKNVIVNDTHDLSVAKEASFDSATGKVNYVVKVTSTGINNNVVITDTFSDGILTFNKDVTWATNEYYESDEAKAELAGRIDSCVTREDGFTLKISSMKNETVYIKYSADVDADKGEATYDNTKNTVTVKSDDNPTGVTKDHTCENMISYGNVIEKKGSERTDSEEQGFKTVDWTINVNMDNAYTIDGWKVMDSIADDSKEIMGYSGEGITVEIDGQPSYTVSWDEIKTDDGKGWQYIIPSGAGKASCKITYTTEVDVSKNVSEVNVSNKAEVENKGNPAWGNVKVPPVDGGMARVEKTHIGQTDTTITWEIKAIIPALGLDSCEITDILPHYSMDYYDIIDKDSIEIISGLLPGESWNITYADDVDEWHKTGTAYETKRTPQFTITFYKGEGETGLLPSEDENQREIIIQFTTTNNEFWMENTEITTTHTNNVELNANGEKKYDWENVDLQKKTEVDHGIDKYGSYEGSWITGYDENGQAIYYPVFKYTLTLTGVKEKDIPFTIEDEFDTDLLELFKDPNKGYAGLIAVRGDGWKEGKVSAQETETGMQITIEELSTKDNGELCENYYVEYYLAVKDAEALKKLNQAAFDSGNNKVSIDNTASWGDASKKITVDYTVPDPIKKSITDWPGENNDYSARYTIEINPQKILLNGGDALTVTDSMVNLRLKPETLIVKADGVELDPSEYSWDTSGAGNTITFKVPDGKAIYIEYRASVLGEMYSNVQYENVVDLKGYHSEQKHNVTINSNGGGLFSNPSINLYKCAYGNMRVPLEGAKFKLYEWDNGIWIPVKDKNGDDVELVTNDKGEIHVEGNKAEDGWTLMEDDRYQLIETEAPDGYTLDPTPITFIISDSRSSSIMYLTGDTIYVRNAKENFRIVKKDSDTKQLLSGARFTLKDADGKIVKTAVTGEDGIVSFSKLKPGTYYLEETEVPDGYKENTTTYEVVINDDLTVTSDDLAFDDSTGSWSADVLNTKNVGSLEIDKSFVGIAPSEVKDYKITVEGNGINKELTLTEDSKNSDNSYKWVVEDLPEGDYTITESGYNLSGYKVDVTITSAGTTINTDRIVSHVEGGQPTGVSLTNTYTKQTGSITVTKKVIGESAPTGDVFYFTLKDAEGHLVENDGKQIHAIKADESVTFGELEYGTYTVTETDIDGNPVSTSKDFTYKVSAVEQTITIGEESKNPTATITNTYYAPEDSWTPSVTKVFSQGKAATNPEFTFEISGFGYDSTNNKIKISGTGSASFATVTYTGLGAVDEYEYTIKEVPGSDSSITYDGATYVVTVKVSVDPADENKLKTEVISVTKTVGETTTTVEDKEVKFTNAYEAKGNLNLTAQKMVDGRQASEGEEFTFELYELQDENDTAEGKQPYRTVTNNGSSVAFNVENKYDQNDIGKEFWYLIKEQQKNVETGYVTDTRSFKVSVSVTVDPTDKTKLIATPDYHGEEAIFNNKTYAPASVPVTAVKVLENGAIDQYRNKFEFELWQTYPGERTLLQTVSNGANANSAAGAVEFDSLNYTRADIGKTYTYEIKEVDGNENNVKYDGHPVTLTVSVDYDAVNQKVVATPKYSEEGTITFRNEYNPTPVSTNLVVEKSTEVPDGIVADLDNMTFSFVVKDSDGKEVATGNSGANGDINFDFDQRVEFTKAGTYNYTITEVESDLEGVTSDSKIITVKVEVPDNYDGTLGMPTVKYYDTNGDELTTPSFENKYSPKEAEIQFSGTKTLDGRDWTDVDKFTFGLWEGTTANGEPDDKAEATAASKAFSFKKLTFSQTGTYQYTVKEIIPDDAANNVKDGITYDTNEYHVTVKVSDDGSGQLEAKLSGDLTDEAGYDFTNTYEVSGKFQLAVYKTVDGKKPVDNEKFTFELRDNAGNLVGEAKQNESLAGSEMDKVLFDEIPYSKEGTYEYTIKEVTTKDGYKNDKNVYTAVVTVTDANHNGEYSISCQYYSNGSKIEAPVTTSGEAVVTINNTSPSDGEAVIVAGKSLSGGVLKEGMFEFTLTSSNDTKLAERVSELKKSNDGSGTVSFGPLKYTKTDLNGDTEKTYEYTITEVNHNEDYIDYDPVTTRTVHVRVYLDGTEIKTEVTYVPVVGELYSKDVIDGKYVAIFHNDYDGTGSFNIKGTKTFNGGTQEREFIFDLFEKGGSEPVDTVTVKVTPDGSASFEFKDVELNKMGDYTYVVKERIPEGAVYDSESQTAVYQGVTYSTKECEVIVHMDDEGNGNFVQNNEKTIYVGGSVAFTNEYNTEDISIDIYGKKVLTGRTKDGVEGGKALQEEEFTFGLYEDGNLVVADGFVNPVTNGAGDNFSFHIDYTEAGTHNYVVKEIPQGTLDENGKLNNIKYDTKEYAVTVVVRDNNDGKLVAEITSEIGTQAKPVTITNSYEAELDVPLSATKTVNNVVPSESERGRFAFTLTGDGQNQTVTNGEREGSAAGSITFESIHYTQADIGRHVYKVSELGRPAGQETSDAQEAEVYEYSDLVYTVTVDVFVNEAGKLDKTVTYTLGDNNATDIIFDNQKHLPSELVFKAKKVLLGEDGGTATLAENDFSFKLTSTGVNRDSRIPEVGITVSNNTAGEVSFTTIKYDLNDIEKTYEYTVEELIPIGAQKDNDGKWVYEGVTYDSKLTRKITVYVDTDADGKIKPIMTCEDAKEVTDSGEIPVFTNTYKAVGSFTPQGTKTLSGRDTDGGEFWFVVKEGDKVLQRVSSNAAQAGEAGKINFTEIKYTLDDVDTVHTYTVSEEHAGEKINGVAYGTGTESYTITVIVSDNYDGTLNVVDTYSPDVTNKTMTFTNTYDAEYDYTLSGTKKLTGRNMEDGEFHFVVMEGDEQKATGTSTQATKGTATVINFTEIHYTLDDLGEHTYTITEVNDGLPKGVAVNNQSFTVVVNVTDNKDGTLTVTRVSEKSDTVAFENTYTASVSLELKATKTVNGEEPTGDEVFTFTLTGGLGDKTENQSKENEGKTVTFDAIPYDQNDVGKTFIYTVKESAEDVKKGYTYDKTEYTVEVTVNRDDTAEGGLSLTKVIKIGGTRTADQTIKFNNTYPKAGEVEIVAKKEWKYGTLTGGEFNFTLTGPKLPVAGQTKPNEGNEIKFDKIPLDESDIGETYVYTITEQVDTSKTGYVAYDTELTRTITVKVGEVNGEVKPTLIVYSSDGKYTEDDKNNEAIFHNTYRAEKELTLVGTKKLAGRDLNNGEFEFMVIDVNKETDNVVATGTNVGEKITFTTITYNQSQIGQTYTYEIKEKGKLPQTPDDGIYYDPTSYFMDVTVTDPNHDGHLVLVYSYPTGGLVFENTYTPTGYIDLTGTKKIDYRTVTGQDHFAFEVYEVVDGKEASTPVTTGTSTGSAITFNRILYTGLKDVRTHTYKIKEVAYDNNGVKSTDVVRTVKVNVTDNKDGTLNAVLTSDSDKIEFTNEYHATGELQLEAWKTVNGEAPGDREFSFILSNDKDSKTDSKTNTADGHVLFDKITFTEADVTKSPITYTIKENIPTEEDAIEGMDYDRSEYKVTVTLTDNQNGHITVNPETIKYVKGTQEFEKALFDNTYQADGQVVIEASKKLKGGALKDKQFIFILKDENGDEVKRTTNKGEKVTFTIDYTLDDIGPHTYTIEEYDGGAAGYTYDGTTFTVNVYVSEALHGGLEITKEYVGVPENEIPQFVNEYSPKEIWISKVDAVSSNELTGASMIITGEAGKVDSWVSDGTRHVFKADYGKTYTLTETAAPEGFLIAESITFQVDSDGVLWIKQADGSFVQQSDSIVTMVDMAAPVKTPDPTATQTPTPETTSTPGTTPSVTETPGPSATPGTTPESTATPVATPETTPGQTPAPEATPTPEVVPTPDNTPNPVVTPGNNPAPTPRGTVLGARKVRMGGTQAAVLGARRGADFAVLGKRRRPSTGDSMALLIWIITMSAAMGGAITSSTLLSLENGRKRRRRR